jgi:hypothetical protein
MVAFNAFTRFVVQSFWMDNYTIAPLILNRMGNYQKTVMVTNWVPVFPLRMENRRNINRIQRKDFLKETFSFG